MPLKFKFHPYTAHSAAGVPGTAAERKFRSPSPRRVSREGRGGSPRSLLSRASTTARGDRLHPEPKVRPGSWGLTEETKRGEKVGGDAAPFTGRQVSPGRPAVRPVGWWGLGSERDCAAHAPALTAPSPGFSR